MTSFGNVAKLGIFKAKGIVLEKWSVCGGTYIIKNMGEKILKLNYSSSTRKLVKQTVTDQKKTSITYWTHDRTILKISQPSGKGYTPCKMLPLGQKIKLQTT